MESEHYGQHQNCDLCDVWRTISDIADHNPDIAALFPRSARWRYYGPRGALGRKPADIYFYTTDRLNARYQSGIYRYLKTRKVWKATDVRKHAKRKDAKQRALKLWHDAQSKEGQT
jgi:hypothetical protein